MVGYHVRTSLIRNYKFLHGLYIMINMKRHFLLLVFSFYFLCYILPLGAAGLFTPDETRYAEIPREMIASGDWVVPHLNGLRYFEKPVLGYWVHAASLVIFGENNFAVRLPSAISVGLSALLIFVMARYISTSDEKNNGYLPALAALVFISCFGVFGIGNIAVLDNLFSLFLTASIAVFYFASEEQPRSSREKYFLVLSGISCGLAFLTKGFLAFAIPVLTIAPYLVWERRYTDIIRMSWVPILVAVLIVLPWGLLIHAREPDFWHFFFWNEHIRRFMEDNAQHKESFWYFFKASPGLFMPWTFLIPAAVVGLKPLINDRSEQARMIRFSLCWFVFPFLFFSASSGKLLTYILPCFPPFALLMFYGLVNIFYKRQNSIFKWGITVTGLFFGLILFALLYVQLVGFNDFHLFREPWKVIMFANSLIVIIVFCFWTIKSSKINNKILLTGISPFFFFFIVHFVIPDTTVVRKIPGAVLENLQNINNQNIVISDEKAISAACWYLKRDDIYLINYDGELNYGLSYPDSRQRVIKLNSVAGFINENREKTVLIGKAKKLERWKDRLPVPVSQNTSGPDGYALWKY